MIKVLHVTAHLGGGVGRVLSSLAINSLKSDVEHIILVLEKTENDQFEKLCKQNNIKVYIAEECDLNVLLSDADIVELDWWHHPLTSEFMDKYLGKIETRLLIWSHISGCSYPYIPVKLINYPDEFVFSSPYSYENKFWSEEEYKEIKDNINVVVSSGLELKKSVDKKEHDSFNIGYIGFLNYSKIHRDFVKYCESVSNIPNVQFILVGDKSYGEELIEDCSNSQLIKDKIEFTGYSNNVYEELSRFDVFGYILNPEHYGTAENVLLEAMAAGVVPVVLNQGCEKYIVKHMKTGILVNTIEEYKQAIEWLFNNPSELKKMSVNASKNIIENYHIISTVTKMNHIYSKLMNNKKKYHDSSEVIGNTPYEWFLTCNKDDIYNLQGNAFAETKGSAKHYLKYFNNDKQLSDIVNRNKEKLK